ncbi:hypothetical protein ACFFKH_01120 [Micromonospora marina]|uniref:hypothetical protein n=1 Tax=Micromonospora marina TaxID=307120 RepID=UPI001ABF033B|nr:hypothetical protein [Micromonospora marina]
MTAFASPGRSPVDLGELSFGANKNSPRSPRDDLSCERCREPWPCPTLRRIPRDQLEPVALIRMMAFLARGAIRDLRGHVEGPEPPEIVRRFFWFLPLSDDEARAIARRPR